VHCNDLMIPVISFATVPDTLCNQLVYTIDEAYIPSYRRLPEMAGIKKPINFPAA
jgi:hypothetical protein